MSNKIPVRGTVVADQGAPEAQQRAKKGTIFAFGIIVALVAGAMLALISVQYAVEGTVANVATLLPVGYAFGAGMVASVNPCGFFILPAYLSYHLGTEEQGFYETSVNTRLLRAVLLAGVATTGFIVIFALVGYIIALGGRWLITFFPIAGLIIGTVMAGFGVWLLVSRKPIGVMAASRLVVTPKKNLRNVFLFGIAYAVGSLSCTLPVFLVVVGSALAVRGLADSFAQFISYALGMGAILVLVTVGAALFKGAVARSMRVLLSHVHTIGSLFMVGAGGYIIYYWIRFGDLF